MNVHMVIMGTDQGIGCTCTCISCICLHMYVHVCVYSLKQTSGNIPTYESPLTKKIIE